MKSLYNKRIAVTGASGFIGSHLVERLLAEGAIVGAIGRTRGHLARVCDSPGFRFVACDLSEPEGTIDAIRSVAPSMIYHLLGYPDGTETVDQLRACLAANVECTVNVLEAFRLAGGDVFIYGDSTKVYGHSDASYSATMCPKPLSSYAISKVCGWELCELYQRIHSLSVFSVRPTMVYGPRQNHNLISFVVNSVLDRKPEIRLDGGSQTRDPLYIDDAVDAFISVGRAGRPWAGQVLNIGGGNEQRVADIARTIVRLMGADTPVVSIQSRIRPTETARSYCDNREAMQLLGWRPRVSLITGLRKTIHSLKELRTDREGMRVSEQRLSASNSAV